jgi:hypothetical protein
MSDHRRDCATRISWMRLGARMAAFVAITYLAAGELTAT